MDWDMLCFLQKSSRIISQMSLSMVVKHKTRSSGERLLNLDWSEISTIELSWDSLETTQYLPILYF